MREQDIRRILKDVCDAFDRRAKAVPIAVGVAMAFGAGCSGNVIVQNEPTASDSAQTTTAAPSQDAATTTDSTPIETEPAMFYMAAFDSNVTDADSASDADTWHVPMCMYMCSMVMYPEATQDPNAPAKP